MTANPVRDLLESVSSGQPSVQRLSVNDLVRAGRQRQRSVALAAAGGTAVVVAGAAGLVSQAIPRSTPSGVGAPSTPPAFASTAPPDPSPGASSDIGRHTTSLAVISAAHVMSNGTQVGTFMRTTGCEATAALRVVRQDEHEVALSLEVPVTRQGVVVRPSQAADAVCPPQPRGATANATDVQSSVEAVARLKVALGTRRLVDASTGRAIPYTEDTQTAYPAWMPAVWTHTSGVRPVDLRTWEQDWATPANGLLSLRQTFGAPDEIGGSANAEVQGHPARIVTGQHGIAVSWWAGGRRYDLAASVSASCTPERGLHTFTCSPAPGSTPPMSQADLLRTANSVVAR